jgi:hypothetical protein
MDMSLLASNGRGESLAFGFSQKRGAPRLELRLQPDV